MSVVARITIAVDRDRAWQRWSDIDSWPEWNPDCLAASLDGDGGPGSRLEFQLRHPRGRDFWTRPSVTVADPGREFTWQTRGLGLKASTQALFSDGDEGTEVEVVGDARGLLAFAWRLLVTRKVEGRLLAGALNALSEDLLSPPDQDSQT